MDAFTTLAAQALRAHALTFPEVTEGTSCVNRAFKVRKKNVVFIGEKEHQVRVMVKLVASREAAAALNDPRVSVGSTGWATLLFLPEDPPDLDLVKGWMNESFQALAPKTVVKAWLAER